MAEKSIPLLSGILEYTHSGSALTGTGKNGKFKATSSGAKSSFTVNGVSYSVRSGEDTSITLKANVWYSFILDSTQKTINFNAGGGLSDTKLASATAAASDVVSGKTFYAGNKTLKTGSFNLSAATATAADVAKGKTFYAGNNTLKTGTMTVSGGKRGSFTSLSNEDYEVSLGFAPSAVMMAYLYNGTDNTTILWEESQADKYTLWFGTYKGVQLTNNASSAYGYVQQTDTGFKFRGYYTSSGTRTIQYVAIL